MRRPFLEYSGQTTAEILAAGDKYSPASLLYALESGLERRGPDYTPAERLLLGVLAFEREVNNGGFAQFFVNSSRQYVADIVGFLVEIGAGTVADLARRAIAVLGADPVTPDSVRQAIIGGNPSQDAELGELDQQFYQLPGSTGNLLGYVRANAAAIVLERVEIPPPPPRRGFTNVTRLELALASDKPADLSFEALRKRIVDLAVAKSITATDVEYDGGVYQYLFGRLLKSGDLARCAELAPRAFELCREDTGHCVCHRKWVEQLLAASRDQEADRAALQYLEYLDGDDKSTAFVRNRIGFFAAVIRPNAVRLPDAAAFLESHFTAVEIQPPRVIYSTLRQALK